MFGQIVYNLEDYSGAGGMISTDINDINKTILSSDDEVYYQKNKIEIVGQNAFSAHGITSVTKLGIQAPPGTKFKIGNIKEGVPTDYGQDIIIGRTGIYELEEGINIELLQFYPVTAYALDVEASTKKANLGRAKMEEARRVFDIWYESHKSQLDTAITTETQSDFWEDYEKNHDDYIKNYEEGRSMYLEGLNGVYVENGTRELRNVIIDFIYTTGLEEVN